MSDQLQGKKMAILVANGGVEEVELTGPLGVTPRGDENVSGREGARKSGKSS